MPKNRSVSHHFEFTQEFLKSLPYPDEVQGNNKSVTSASPCFGERVTSSANKQYEEKSSRSPSISGVSDFDVPSFGQSSASSISWSDEFETEATKKVQKEFERMERVLQGIEPIPLHYNKDEYEQWITTFPQLSLTGIKMKYPKCLAQTPRSEEVFAFHSNRIFPKADCDTVSTSAEVKRISDVKNAVIEKVLETVSAKLFENENEPLKINKKATKKSRSSLADLNHQFSFLKISPVLLQEPKSTTLDSRQRSSNSIARSERLASRWMKDEFSSLPCVSNNSAKRSLPRKSVKPSPRKTHVSLPPIKNLPSASYYRSISATPRQMKKETCFKQPLHRGSKISQLEVPYFNEDDGDSLRRTRKHRKD